MTRACRPLTAWRRLAALSCAAALLAARPATAQTCSGLGLGVPSSGATQADPTAVAVGDFDRNGRLDVVTANSGAGTVTVLLGNGAGGLAPHAASVAGGSPVDIAVGDLDRNGALDLVVADGSGPRVFVMEGVGGANFGSGVAFPLGIRPWRVSLADFDRDGLLDLLVVSQLDARLRVFKGLGTLSLGALLADLDLGAGDPVAAATGDFDRDGDLDVAVVLRFLNQVAIFTGNGVGALTFTSTTPVGPGARDIAAGDVDRDGRIDLVTANAGGGSVSVLRGDGTGAFAAQNVVTVGGTPARLALVDLDRDGALDLAVVDEGPPLPRLVAFRGKGTFPDAFDGSAFDSVLPAPSAPRGLATGDFTSDGSADLVTAAWGPDEAIVVPNLSGSSCARTSFAGAPHSHAVGDGPVGSVAADFDFDGRRDLAVATINDSRVWVLKGSPTGFVTSSFTNVSPAPKGLATADFDFDGRADVVVALSDGSASSGVVQVLLGNGLGGLTPGDSESIGFNVSAVAVGDFDGNGSPDVAVTTETNGAVYVYLGDGAGGLAPYGSNPVLSGLSAPRALVAAELTGDGQVDIAVAVTGGSVVHVLRNDGGGDFADLGPMTVGLNPRGIAAGDLDADGNTDLVTADNGSASVSVLRGTGSGTFAAAVSHPVGSSPSAVAIADLGSTTAPDIAVATLGSPGVDLLLNDGAAIFTVAPARATVRSSPQAVTPIDADGDGLTDLAVPCRLADGVVVLLARPPGPPPFSAAPRVGVGAQPRGAVSVDLDGDGDLDLAVANMGDDSVSLLRNDGGVFTAYRVEPVGRQPSAIVAADLDRDGRIDLAVNSPGETTPGVSVLLGSAIAGEFLPYTLVPVGTTPDDLAAGDFDRDGDLDLAVCDREVNGFVRLLGNNGAGVLAAVGSVAVGDKPTALVAADLDRDGDLDLAVANDDSNDVSLLFGNGLGGFTAQAPLALGAFDTSPVSLAVGDFNGDDALDLVAASFGNDRLHVFRNLGAGTFAAPALFDAPNVLLHVAVADLNRDGRPDLAAATGGLTVFRGRGSLDLEPPESIVAGNTPWNLAMADFDRDGRPDVAVVNDSNDVTILLSTACDARRLDVSVQPLSCATGPSPYSREAVVQALDDGGNLAACAAGNVTPGIVPGTGAAGAVLGGPAFRPVANGEATFTGPNALTMDRAGRRYRLSFSLTGVPPATTRSFTLGAELAILGTPSVCPGESATFGAEGSYDEYVWTVNPPASPFAFTPTATLTQPPLTVGSSPNLRLQARVDGCSATTNLLIYVGELVTTTLAIQGLETVCVDCIGGTVKALDLGGGPAASRQWGYRTVSAGVITGMPGETGETYVLKGASFPGPGTYYVVVTTTPTCGTARVSTEHAVTVIAPVPGGEVQHLAASARGASGTGGQVDLQWVNSAVADEVRIRWNKALTGQGVCVPPPDTLVLASGEVPITTLSPGVKDEYPHSGLEFDTAYCYSVFVRVGTAWSLGRTVKARPFDADAGPLKWAYSTGATSVVPPVVGKHGILLMSNDRTVHALTRGGTTGGAWPPDWVPRPLAGVAHSRSPIVPFSSSVVVAAGESALFVGDDSGDVSTFNARTGQPAWTIAPNLGKPVTGAPGGLFVQYGGVRDVVLVGTRDAAAANALHGLSLTDGSDLPGSPFTAGGTIGAISGAPAVDYATQRVYFASRRLAAGPTLWCVQVATAPLFAPCSGWTNRDLGDIDGSPVLRNGRVYVGNNAGIVYSIDAATGFDERTFVTGDGGVKGFLFPDRRNDDLMFATNTRVWSISDTGAGTMSRNWDWTPGGLNPSVILFWPQTSYVYVGSNGTLYEIDFTLANPSTPPLPRSLVLGDGLGQLGAPTLDIGVEPPAVSAGKKLLVVGSESGVLYGVEVPFP